MWKIILHYQEYPVSRKTRSTETTSLRPVIDIGIPGKTKVKAIIDSGADRSISFVEVGTNIFGIDFSKDPLFPHTVSGLHSCSKNDCEFHPGNLKQYERSIEFYVDKFPVILNIIWINRRMNPERDFPILLGRDFFNFFDILFKQAQEIIELYPK